jgi:hypothetical protein
MVVLHKTENSLFGFLKLSTLTFEPIPTIKTGKLVFHGAGRVLQVLHTLLKSKLHFFF